MNISVLQHAAFEGPGEIAIWAEERGHAMRVHHLYRQAPLPDPGSFDFLVVMGGEMNVYQYRDWPWLKPERELIEATLKSGKPVVGICLGAQLIADALGARVTQNGVYELGWFPVTFTGDGPDAFPDLPDAATVLHWHGDTFALPDGATRLAMSPGCPEQGYVIKNKCLGLQFHLEVDPSLVKLFVEGQTHWPTGPYVQTPDAILDEAATYAETNRRILHGLLDAFCPTVD